MWMAFATVPPTQRCEPSLPCSGEAFARTSTYTVSWRRACGTKAISANNRAANSLPEKTRKLQSMLLAGTHGSGQIDSPHGRSRPARHPAGSRRRSTLGSPMSPTTSYSGALRPGPRWPPCGRCTVERRAARRFTRLETQVLSSANVGAVLDASDEQLTLDFEVAPGV